MPLYIDSYSDILRIYMPKFFTHHQHRDSTVIIQRQSWSVWWVAWGQKSRAGEQTALVRSEIAS